MSIDFPIADSLTTVSDDRAPTIDLSELRDPIQRNRRSVEHVFRAIASDAGVYRWGVASASDGPVDIRLEALSILAYHPATKQKRLAGIDWDADCHDFVDAVSGPSLPSTLKSAEAVVWASALPGLIDRLDETSWWRLLTALQQLHESALQCDRPFEANHLILGGELGLTLSGLLAQLPHCKSLRKGSVRAVKQWCMNEVDSIAFAISGVSDARLTLASFLRSRCWIRSLESKKFPKKLLPAAQFLATWVAATTRADGTAAFSNASRKDIRDDLPPHGLLQQAKQLDSESLTPAINAALGDAPKTGRLAWEVFLPEAMQHDEEGKLASMFCQWDVRRCRTTIDYAGEEVRLEIAAGKKLAISGTWQTQIELDGIQQRPVGSWSEVCEFTDDDVHYLEIEQPWSGNVNLQRQVLLFRDDRAMLVADAVLPTRDASEPLGRISYSSRLPLDAGFNVSGEEETRELYLSDKQRRVMVFPLSACEWKVGPSDAVLGHSEDHHLNFSATGSDRLYCPLWLDFLPRRFKRQRTWRQLTVVDQLQIVPARDAAAYRVQLGSEQWVVYRSLCTATCRTFLGKHLMADFFCSRFDPSDGNHEELITVDDSRDDE